MFILEDEIKNTIKDNSLSLIEIQDENKERFLKKIYDVFVKNNPSALWLDFQYKAESLDYETSIQNALTNLISEEKEIFFVIDDFNVKYHIYKGKIKDIVTFIDECIGLDEYYIIYDEFTKLICENDHGELLFIDININERRWINISE